MKRWIKRTGTIGLLILLSACAGLPKPEVDIDDSLRVKPKIELPADYAAALDLIKRKRYGPAEGALKEYAARNPLKSSPHVNLALVYRATQRDELAMQALETALQINPQQAAAMNLQGVYAREAGDFDAAKTAYLNAITADPQYPNAYLNLAILTDLYLHNPRAALAYYEQYASLMGEDQLEQQVKSWIADARRQAKL